MHASHDSQGRSTDPCGVLDGVGIVRACNTGAKALFRADAGQLVGSHVSLRFPRFACGDLIRGGLVAAHLEHLCHCGVLFSAARGDGEIFIVRSPVNRVGADGGPQAIRLSFRAFR